MLVLNFNNETKNKVTDRTGMTERIFKSVLARFYEVLKRKVDKMLRGQDWQVSLILVDDKKIRKLNRDYRGKDAATDVLSFAYLEGKKMPIEKRASVVKGGGVSPKVSVGDIFISIDTAKRQAKEKNHSLEREMMILFTHGMLHLFGFTHENDEDEAEMESFSKKILVF